MLFVILDFLFVLLTLTMAIYLVRHYLFTLAVLRHTKICLPPPSQLSSYCAYQPTVSILIPAHNEAGVIARLLQRTTELTYPTNKFDVIVIDDGSTDETGKIADTYAAQFSFIKVLHREKTEGGKGKTAAMNAGFRYSTGEIILCFDADYYPQKNIVEKLVNKFESPKIGAVQGRVVVLNEPQNLVTRLVALERIGGYRVDQEARSLFGLITQFGGTVGGFRRSLLEELGGWDETILAEDTDLTFRVYLAGYVVGYAVDAECYEEAVDNWGAYWKQRYRWARGHMQCCFKHSLKVFTSKNLSLLAKIDGLLLLNVYFMPLIVLLSLIVGIPLLMNQTSSLPFINALWFVVPITFYSFVGNFAPFFEVGIGAYLDGRKQIQWLTPLLLVAFLYNIPICVKAFVDTLGSKLFTQSHATWDKTEHLGKGSVYLNNSSIAGVKSQ